LDIRTIWNTIKKEIHRNKKLKKSKKLIKEISLTWKERWKIAGVSIMSLLLFEAMNNLFKIVLSIFLPPLTDLVGAILNLVFVTILVTIFFYFSK